MDLGGLVTHVCSKLSQTDPASTSICAGFAQKWYQGLFDRYPWRDSITTLPANVSANVSSVALPTGISRVISIRYGGNHFIDPVDDNFLVQADPTIFDRTGIPQYYREYTASDGTKQIQLYPTPSVDGLLLVVGKKTLLPLVNNSDVPIIRNIDNTLLAYMEGEMLERQRQRGGAKLKFDEAALLYQEAENLEKQQTNVPRRTKNLTVSGDSL